MNLFERIIDLATNNSSNYSREKQIYDDTNKELLAIEDLLNLLIEGNIFYEYPEIFKNITMSPQNIKDFKKVKLKQMANASTDKERLAIKKEILNLESLYLKNCEDMKNCLLKCQDIKEIQEHIVELNFTITRHITYEAFRKFHENYPGYEWTLDKMEILKNLIAKRTQELIPYLGRISK